jgi:hypothetical protein
MGLWGCRLWAAVLPKVLPNFTTPSRWTPFDAHPPNRAMNWRFLRTQGAFPLHLNKYREGNSDAAKKWERYSSARQATETIENRLFGFMPPQRPHELGPGGFRVRRGA